MDSFADLSASISLTTRQRRGGFPAVPSTTVHTLPPQASGATYKTFVYIDFHVLRPARGAAVHRIVTLLRKLMTLPFVRRRLASLHDVRRAVWLHALPGGRVKE